MIEVHYVAVIECGWTIFGFTPIFSLVNWIKANMRFIVHKRYFSKQLLNTILVCINPFTVNLVGVNKLW